MNIVKVPFPLPSYKVGDKVPVDEFMAAAGAYVKLLLQEKDDMSNTIYGLEDQLGWVETQLQEAKQKISDMQEDIHEFYQPISKHRYNGVSDHDF